MAGRIVNTGGLGNTTSTAPKLNLGPLGSNQSLVGNQVFENTPLAAAPSSNAANKNYVGGNNFYSTPPASSRQPAAVSSSVIEPAPLAAPAQAPTNQISPDVYEALIDEVRHFEEELNAATGREQLLMRSVEALAGYTSTLEAQVIVPAMGELNVAVAKFHDVAAARQQGLASVNVLESQGVVTPQNNPQAARIFAALQRPSAQTLQGVERNQLLSQQLRGGPNAAEDALVMASGMLNATEQLQANLAEAMRNVDGLRAGGGGAVQSASPQPQVAAMSGDAMQIQREYEALKKEVELIHQNYHSKLQLAEQEKELAALQSGSSSQIVQRLENENKTLQLKIEALLVKEDLLAQATQEKHALQQRVEELERTVAQNAQDKLEVAARFETLQRYIEQAAVSQHNPAGEKTGLSSPGGHTSPLLQGNTVPKTDLDTALTENRMLKEQLHKLQAESTDQMSLLRQQLVTAQQKVHQLDGRAGSIDEFTKELQRLRNARAGSPLDSSDESVATYKSKIKVFEMTVTALNAELSALEEKLVVIERNAVEDRRRLLDEMESERQQHKDEQAECDAVVHRITTELEGLMQENAQLKTRLREYHKQLTQGGLTD